ncbi:MAG: acetyl-CoA carboxylase, carboxyltransferase subunit beta [Bacteroidia bacterium]|nr:acetyl-CoA carboxylase, carboxyltransferase subunit beta [Bacteroidia bacterium]
MSWFKRLKEGIQTSTVNKKEVPDGLWSQCKGCGEASTYKKLKENLFVCPHCEHHYRIGSHDYFDLLYDGKYEELFTNLESIDILKFTDLQSYPDRLAAAKKKTQLKEAISVTTGKIGKYPMIIAAMDFTFIGGSMGSVMGEKIALAIEHAIEHKIPLMIISKSGGARMMESAYSLMQLAKTSAMLTKLSESIVPYFSFLTDPTTGGVTASFAMLGDINFSEPGALIGFAGPRVIKETIKRDLPEGFQTSEYVMESGFLDFIIHRKELKERLQQLLCVFNKSKASA